MKAKTKDSNPCYRCRGEGKIREYSHIANGQCFGCAGTGIEGQGKRPKRKKYASIVDRLVSKEGHELCFKDCGSKVEIYGNPEHHYVLQGDRSMSLIKPFARGIWQSLVKKGYSKA